jgi:hypothetical protein
VQRNHALADVELVSIWSSGGNDASELVAEHRGSLYKGEGTLAIEDIAVGNRAGRDFHENLPSCGHFYRDAAQLEGLWGLGWGGQDNSAHILRYQGGEFWHSVL